MSYNNNQTKKSFDNTNTGALFKNDKMKNDKSPAYTGKINIGGKDYYLSGWVKQSKKNGQSFFSLSVTDPATVQRPAVQGQAGGYQQQHQAPAPRVSYDANRNGGMDADIPF